MGQASTSLNERLALIASPDALEQIGARLEELTDPDVRAEAIAADHPELEQALREDLDEVTIDGQPVSIRLHLAMHEIVAKQLVDNDPPEVFQTANRLLAAGYDRHETLHMLAAPLARQIHATLTDGAACDRQQHLAALAALPGSWERQRTQQTLKRNDPHSRHAARRHR
jgi:hypothetical protein